MNEWMNGAVTVCGWCQMAYYKLTGGKTAATYESCSTAAFKHGRTEVIRSATTATANACRLFHQPSSSRPSRDELMSALMDCTSIHNQLMKEAAMGLSFTWVHLFYPFDTHCCHMDTAVKYFMPDQVKPSFVIFWHPGTLANRAFALHLKTYLYIVRRQRISDNYCNALQ